MMVWRSIMWKKIPHKFHLCSTHDTFFLGDFWVKEMFLNLFQNHIKPTSNVIKWTKMFEESFVFQEMFRNKWWNLYFCHTVIFVVSIIELDYFYIVKF